MSAQSRYNKTPKGKFVAHKASAKARGIAFNFTLSEWLAEWSPYVDKRGVSSESYQMCRYKEKGAYEPGNVYMATLATNRHDTKRFSEGEADEIRKLVASKNWSQRAIAAAYGVADSTISYVVNRKGVYA